VAGLWAQSVASDRSAEADGLNRTAARVNTEAEQLAGGSDPGNDALSDPERTREVSQYLNTAIAQTFSYDYRDLAKTRTAVGKYLTGDARCEYDELFGEVERYAPEQRIVLETTVRALALSHLGRDDAQALVYIDQRSTRTDVNKTVSVGGQFAVQAHREGNHWKITEFDMFGQPLFNGKPAPTC
jgi:Mce-associated membrane protein